jgi:hypothetical protein
MNCGLDIGLFYFELLLCVCCTLQLQMLSLTILNFARLAKMKVDAHVFYVSGNTVLPSMIE